MSSSVLKKENENLASQNDDATSEFSTPQFDKKDNSPHRTESQSDIAELRKLLVKPDEVSDVLPDAVRKSSEKDGTLAAATLPIVEDNIRESAARDPKILAQALYPVIGPAIRKAISQALGAMVQSLNQTLEHSISPKGIAWRIEALRTGRSFGEIVMMKTLLFKVEQVFLIHKKTGLLLQHVTADKIDIQDADMISAMLTAIQDFVQDSFKTSEDATLDSLKIEELSVWIEHSPDAVLAGVIRGTPPLSLRETFSQAAEEIQYFQEGSLKKFDGDSEVFEKSRPILERCLEYQANEEKASSSIFKPMNILAAGLLGLLLIFGFFYLRDYYRWSNYVTRLKAEPGILVAEADRGFFTHSISGLRDPLSIDPKELTEEYGFDPEDVEQDWKAYHDTNQVFLLKRAEKLLKPPSGVKLSFENGVLSAAGNVSQDWITNAGKLSTALIGVNEFRSEGGTLLELKSRIESQVVLFDCNTTDFARNQENKLDSLAEDLESFAEASKISRITVLGYSSKSGSAETNQGVSDLRAQKTKAAVLSRSEKLKKLIAAGKISLETEGLTANQESKGCAVTFSVKADSK